MTISSEVCAVTYPGDGVNTHFDYNFIVPSASDGSAQVFLVYQDPAGAVSFVPPSEFLITGLNSPTGGTVTYPILGTPVAAGAKLSIIRGRPYTQEIAISNQSFYPRTLEQIADYTVMQTQQLQEKVGRALSVPPGEVLTYIPALALRRGKVLGFDSSGQPVAVSAGGGGGGSNDWDDLFNVPALITSIEGLNPLGVGNRIVQFSNLGVASLIPTPSGTVVSVNGLVGAVVLDYTDVGAAPLVHTQAYTTITNFGLGVNSALAAGANVTLSYVAGVTTINSSGGAGGSMQPVLMSTYAAIDGGGVNVVNNDTAITAAESSAQTAAYWPEGTYKTSLGVIGIADAVMTGSIGPGTAVMTISGVTSGAVRIGQKVTGTGVAWNTYVVNQLTGPAGSVGTYTVSVAQTVGGGTALTMFGAMTKGYVGRGRILTGASFYPANISYAIQKPSPAGTGIGVGGWWSGDFKFGDGGEYRIIGPDIRTYDLASQYYQPTLMPHNAWFDSLSGNSGLQAYINNLAVAGGQPTVRVNNVPDANWVGKQCQIQTAFSGTTIETKTVQSVNVGTNEVTFTTNIGALFTASITAGVMTVTAIASGVLGARQYITGGGIAVDTFITQQLTGAAGGIGTYAVSGTVNLAAAGLNAGYSYSPTTGSFPNLRFSLRTWNGHTYIKVKAGGGGDTYGHIIRTTMEYTPKLTELGHTFYAGTVGQYGGDVNFIAGSSGTYATSMEFAAYDQGNDVAYISYVSSFVRSNDRGGMGLPSNAGGGRVWLGHRLQSSGARAADVGMVVAGNWRYGLDTAQAFLKESTVTQDPHFVGNTTITLYSTNGAQANDPIVISDGVHSYSGTIVSIIPGGVTITPGLNFDYGASTYVEFPEGGALLNAALKQKIVWNSKGLNYSDGVIPNVGELRGIDKTTIFPPFWGNQQGDIETGADNDASGDHWYTKFNGRGHSGATAKIRLYTTDFRCNVKIQSGATIEAALEMVSTGLTGVAGITGAFVASAGSGNMLRYNNSLNRWELLKANAVVATW